MTPLEFGDWLKDHKSYRECKPLRDWFAKLPKAEKGELVVEWISLLRGISKDQATKATRRMHANGELQSTPPEGHVGRILELARTMRDPLLERRLEQERAAQAKQERAARQRLEEEFGAELDRFTEEELDELIGTLPERQRHSLRKSMGLSRKPLKSPLIRPILLKAMKQRSIPAGPKSEEQFEDFRKDIFGSLGETPDFNMKTNDQWE